mgnify:FL=1
MPFTSEQTTALLQVPYVGKTVIQRLQEVGLDDVHTLANSDATEVLEVIAAHLHSSCWKNSPQAKQSINNVIAWAKQYP